MVQNMRLWLAPLLTILLLVAHAAVQRQTDFAAAENALPSRAIPTLSIVEANDFPGNLVTVRGKVISTPATSPDGNITAFIEDETGTLRISVEGASTALRKGYNVQVTGKIGGDSNMIVLKTRASEIVVLP
ncbi:hypothetical protein FE783_19410 [Paenibacillus mesophilus]|uniref:OB-fold nucleic acid binding domain-containing protein n=1 Tax=Paenibacillus mesophilus TaxID=2582849 RepID=UPI00110E1E38|nr:OB-fold nucleic acid binding domain-containing protein [Paenibacillus mesophilus]TMV48122.1 hypothetical protein FE783_19410 [Paenibacillus mesophilus]